jgi:hypothetical protein
MFYRNSRNGFSMSAEFEIIASIQGEKYRVAVPLKAKIENASSNGNIHPDSCIQFL